MARFRVYLLAFLAFLSLPPALAAQTKQPAAGTVVAGARVPPGADAKAFLKKRLGPKLDTKVVLTDGSRTVWRTRRQIGIRLDIDRMLRGVKAKQAYVPLVLTVDLGAMKDALGRIGKVFRQPAINAKPYAYRGVVRIHPGTYARSLNVPTTAARIQKTLAGKAATTRFTVALNKKPPTLTAARLKGINGILSSFSTRASGSAKRLHNIRLALKSIDGTLLSPGETFSLNRTIGQRTQARGYRTAPVFEEREVVPGIGGGVSQVTGTLFNAAALAGLKIVEVHPHSRPVSYLPVGRDATLAWEAMDLKFTNNTDAPVYIAYTLDGRRLRATFFGKKVPGKKVRLTARAQRQAPGKITAQLYRTTRKDGRVAAKERIFRHTYKWDPKTG